jgi:hypothetical protein
MSPYAAITSLSAAINGAKTETQKLGGKFILKDGQLNPNTQASQINELISQGVNAMMIYPVNPAALLPGIAAAKKKGIRIVMEDTPPVAGSPLIPGSSTDILQGRDTSEYGVAQAAVKADPGGKYVNLALAVPVPLLQYGVQRDTYWANKFGMKYLGAVSTPTDTPGGAATDMTSIWRRTTQPDSCLRRRSLRSPCARPVTRCSFGNSSTTLSNNPRAAATEVDRCSVRARRQSSPAGSAASPRTSSRNSKGLLSPNR